MKEDQIDKKNLEISQAGDEVFKSMEELADELPDNSPRFVLLSYPLTLVWPIGSNLSDLEANVEALVFWSTISAVRDAELSPTNLLE